MPICQIACIRQLEMEIKQNSEAEQDLITATSQHVIRNLLLTQLTGIQDLYNHVLHMNL